MQRPAKTLGMRHVALNVSDLEACEQFYVGLLGMTVEWRPDTDNVYLTSGNDNLALHRVADYSPAETGQRLEMFYSRNSSKEPSDLDPGSRRCHYP
jgi:catechol 2,3-dioxygenase-like lactoylglutathione lyase family enzyme